LFKIVHRTEDNFKPLLDKSKENRVLFVVFTIRAEKVRVISARDLNKKERKFYKEKN
jgi:uncharacterized DUF497 family protein